MDDTVELTPGQRVRVSFDGIVIERDGRAVIQTASGSLWALPEGSKVEVVEAPAAPA